MVSFLTNPRSFMAFSRIAAPVLGVATVCAFALGLYEKHRRERVGDAVAA